MIPDEGFPKKEHLLKTGDFRIVYKEGKFAKAGPLVLYCHPNSLENNRMGISVSSKKVKLSTRRNRIKRLLREAYRKNKKRLKNGFDLVVSIKRDPGESITYKEMAPLFLKAAKETGIWQ